MKPKISILVPCYNVEKYIRQCMDSIINQTLKDIEIICINDGSKDNTLAILEEYSKNDDRITIINKSNSGYGHSMNMGIRAASGEYIGIVESDDFVERNMFESLYNLAQENKVKVVKSNFYRYTEKDGDKKINLLPFDDLNKVINPRIRSEIFYCQPSIWSAIYSRTFINQYKINFLETPGASYQDIGFNFKVWAMADKIWLTSDAFLHYRCDNENASVKSKDKVFCVSDEWANIEKYMDDYPEDKKISVLLRNHVKMTNYNWNLDRLTDEKREEFRKLYAEEYQQALIKNELKRETFSRKEWLLLLEKLYPNSAKLRLWIILEKIKRIFIKTKVKNNKKIYSVCFGLFKVYEKPCYTNRPTFYEGKKICLKSA